MHRFSNCIKLVAKWTDFTDLSLKILTFDFFFPCTANPPSANRLNGSKSSMEELALQLTSWDADAPAPDRADHEEEDTANEKE